MRSACAAICAGPNSKGTSLRVRFTSAFALLAKLGMKMQQTPRVPKNARVSDRSWQGPQLAILSTRDGSGSHPYGMHLWPTTVISSAHKTVFGPLKVLPQYLARCTTRLTPWKCSQINWQIPGFSVIRSSLPLASRYQSSGLRSGTSSIYGTVMCGISGCRMCVMSSWNIGTEFVHPMGSVTSHRAPKGDWKVVRSRESGASPHSL